MRRQRWASVMVGAVIVALSAATLTWLALPRLHAAAAGSVTVTTDLAQYSDTQPIQVTVTNGLSQPIYAFDTKANCSILDLQIQVSAVWQPSTQAPCPLRRAARPILIGMGGTYTTTIHATTRLGAPSAFTAGSYRLALQYGLSSTTINTTVYSAVFTVTSLYGDGSDGPLTLFASITDSPLDATCTGSAGATSLSFDNASGSFASSTGKPILIHQSQGSGAGNWETNKIVSVSGGTTGTLFLANALSNGYSSGAQVIVLPQYTNVTINSGVNWVAKAWNGSKGGIVAFLATGTVTINGTISADGLNGSNANGSGAPTPGGSGRGFRGGSSDSPGQNGWQGEGVNGTGAQITSANGNAGGGGYESSDAGPNPGAGGGGGGNGSIGSNGTASNSSSIGGAGGATAGTLSLSNMVFGGGGGGGAVYTGNSGGGGGGGGGIIYIAGASIVLNSSGVLSALGGNGGAGDVGLGGGGGGAGGSILLIRQSESLSGAFHVDGGAGGPSGSAPGGAGGSGRVAVRAG
ncbi:MAG TPA: hypothetical protein VH349_09010 [Ktedonobacterales bacterium]|jgi:hypothetical protein